MKILFADSCIRSQEKSRTWRLCRTFLNQYQLLHPDDEIQTIRLNDEMPLPMDSNTLDRRNQLISQGDFNNPIFQSARQFASADKIIVGAPYWDLSFPAALKCYVEQVSVNGITFGYEKDGSVGKCQASKLLCISTSGGIIGDMDFGNQYLKGICGFFGIEEFESQSAQGLDIEGADVEEILRETEESLKEMVKSW